MTGTPAARLRRTRRLTAAEQAERGDQTSGAAVVVTDLQKSYGLDTGLQITAASHLHLTISPGSVVAITGPSGSGKSTLLHLIGAIDRPDAGCITVDHTVVTGLKTRQLAQYPWSVGFVFQRYNLLPALTAVDYVLAPVLPYRTGYDKHARAVELLAAVGLAGRERGLPRCPAGNSNAWRSPAP